MSSRAPTPSTPATRTWPPVTVPVSARFRSGFAPSPLTTRGTLKLIQSYPCTPTGQQILRVAEIEKASDVRRPNIKQLLTPNLRFPLPHRVVKSRSLFLAHRPSTFY